MSGDSPLNAFYLFTFAGNLWVEWEIQQFQIIFTLIWVISLFKFYLCFLSLDGRCIWANEAKKLDGCRLIIIKKGMFRDVRECFRSFDLCEQKALCTRDYATPTTDGTFVSWVEEIRDNRYFVKCNSHLHDIT